MDCKYRILFLEIIGGGQLHRFIRSNGCSSHACWDILAIDDIAAGADYNSFLNIYSHGKQDLIFYYYFNTKKIQVSLYITVILSGGKKVRSYVHNPLCCVSV